MKKRKKVTEETPEAQTRSKRARASRRKGKRGERVLCRRLEKAFGVPFNRTPASGGLRWGKRADVRGDVVCEEPWFPFVLEEKNREAWDLETFLKGLGPIWKWWGQVVRDGKDTGRIPLLFVDKNRSPGFVIFRLSDVGPLLDKKPRSYMSVYKPGVGVLRLVETEEFLSKISVEKCREALSDVINPV